MHRSSHGGGSWLLDRVFRDVGRVRRHTGTQDRDVAKSMDVMLTQLHQHARLDVLESLRDGLLSPREVYAAWRETGVQQLPSAVTMGAVLPRWDTWAATLGTEHGRNASGWARKVLALHLPPGGVVKSVPSALRDIRRTFAKQPRSANMLRALILAFLRDTVSRAHPLYGEVLSLRRLKEPRPIVRKMTLADVRAAAVAVGERLAPIVWSLALSGMRPVEYWVTPWELLPDRVRILGGKSRGSFREVPRVGTLVRAPVARVTFRKAFKRATPQWRVYDLRHAYAGLLEAAGVPRARRQMYMGRSARDTQDLYELGEVSEFLAADAARITTYLAGETR